MGALRPSTSDEFDLLAQIGLGLAGEEAALAEAGIAQGGVETVAAELARGVLQVGIGAHRGGDRVVGNRQAQRRGALIERGLGDQALQHFAVEAERVRLRVGQARLRTGLDLIHQILQLALELLAGDHGAADFGDLVGDQAAEHVADAPDDETDDDEAEQRPS